jgi:hypothetical protein
MFTKFINWIKGLFGGAKMLCPYCSQKYKTIAELNSHITKNHPGKRQIIDMKWDA